MNYVVYLDVFFCFNLLMDWLLLLILRKMEGCKKKRIWCFGAAIFGAVYSVATFGVRLPKMMQWAFTYLIVGPAMIGMSMEWKGIRNQIRRMIYLYIGIFLCSGTMLMVSTVTERQKELYQYTGLQRRVDWKICIGTMVFYYGAVREVVRSFRDKFIRQGMITDVVLKMKDREVALTALCDTGNRLVEPMTGKPVCVMEEKIFEMLGNDDKNVLYIPYHSVDRSHGIMEGFWGEVLTVYGKSYEKIPIAISPKNISKNREYNIILPPEYFMEKGKRYE